MSVTTKIKNTKEKVRKLLLLSREYRDSDEALVVRYWWEELVNSQNLSCHDFFNIYKKGLVTASDTITRARRLLQEEFPELRGEKWSKRKEQELDVRKNINS